MSERAIPTYSVANRTYSPKPGDRVRVVLSRSTQWNGTVDRVEGNFVYVQPEGVGMNGEDKVGIEHVYPL